MEPPTQKGPSPIDRAIPWLVAGTGLLLPWATAAGVKLYLQGRGMPTQPWSEFVRYAEGGSLASAIYAAPFYVLAFIAHAWAFWRMPRWLPRTSPAQRRLVLLLTLAGGAVGMVRVFIPVFLAWDPHVLLYLPILVLMYLPWMAGGLVAGVAAAAVVGTAGHRPGPSESGGPATL